VLTTKPLDDYYHEEFHFCKPADGVQKRPESLGSILFGDRIFNSPFKVRRKRGVRDKCAEHNHTNSLICSVCRSLRCQFARDSLFAANVSCQALCDVTVPLQDAKFINERIKEDYSLNWLVDGLPAAELKQDTSSGQIFYDIGFDLGREGALNNHYDIVLKYHKRGPDTFRVVGVLVWASSLVRQGTSFSNPSCNRGAPLILSEDKDNKFYYTYSVEWEESDTPWATRWDNYLHVFDPRIHTFSLINSIVMVVFLCALVSSILVRSVNRDVCGSLLSSIDPLITLTDHEIQCC
jgi:transmembrane 9 superfamily member 2/4